MFVLASYFREHIQKKRICLTLKISVLKKYLVKDDQSDKKWTIVIGRAISKIMGVTSDVDKLIASLNNMGYHEAIVTVEGFVEKQLKTQDNTYSTISLKEHRTNKFKWKSLKEEFKKQPQAKK